MLGPDDGSCRTFVSLGSPLSLTSTKSLSTAVVLSLSVLPPLTADLLMITKVNRHWRTGGTEHPLSFPMKKSLIDLAA